MSDEALASAHRVGSVLAACAGGALLVAHPERYVHWSDTLGVEQARVRLVDWLSRVGQFFANLESGVWSGSDNLLQLETPLRGLLVQIVGWDGHPPVPEGAIAAAQAALPLLGIARLDPEGYDAREAPTLPTAIPSQDVLESLSQELIDERTEVRLLLTNLVSSAGLSAAMVGYRSGEAIACIGCDSGEGPTCVATHAVDDTTPLVSDMLDTSDLFFSIGIREPENPDSEGAAPASGRDSETAKPSITYAAVRLTGAHAMLAGTASSRSAVERLRDRNLGFTLNSLLESFRFRVDRTSAPPTLTRDDDLERQSY